MKEPKRIVDDEDPMADITLFISIALSVICASFVLLGSYQLLMFLR